MSKGNILLGYARGAIGDVVLSRVKGQQVAKARNRKPANPKTVSQMKTRSAFLSPVLFFSRGNQAQFKFAFEDKQSTESDYNAFMRHNATVGIPLSPSHKADINFPALGRYTVSVGSLPSVPVDFVSNVDSRTPCFDIITEDGVTTWGHLSAKLKQLYGLQEGDILTFFCISKGMFDENLIDPFDGKWDIKQLKVDSSSTALLASVGISAVQYIGSVTKWGFSGMQVEEYVIAGAGCIVSRNTADGLKVSTCTMKLNRFALAAYLEYTSQAHREKVAAEWGATADALLTGTQVDNGQ